MMPGIQIPRRLVEQQQVGTRGAGRLQALPLAFTGARGGRVGLGVAPRCWGTSR